MSKQISFPILALLMFVGVNLIFFEKKEVVEVKIADNQVKTRQSLRDNLFDSAQRKYLFEKMPESYQIGEDNILISQTEISVPENIKLEQKNSVEVKSVVADPLRIYGNALGITLRSHISRNTNEVSTFMGLIKKPTTDLFDSLLLLSEKYTRTAGEIDRQGAPEKIAELKKMLVESYRDQGTALNRLAELKNVGTISGENFKPYNESVKNTAKSLINIALFFRRNGVVFGNSEAGAIFNLPN